MPLLRHTTLFEEGQRPEHAPNHPNIDRFKELLKTKTDRAKPAIMVRLLADEEESPAQEPKDKKTAFLGIAGPPAPMRRLNVDPLFC